jgi:hypothetical protein
VELPAAISAEPSVMAFSMAKAGSTLLFRMLRQLAPTQKLVYFSIEDYLFSRNISPTNRPGHVGKVLAPEGYCYGGFRQYPAFHVPLLHSHKTVFLVRDPRDMITSLYFSLRRSHQIPEPAKSKTKSKAKSAPEASEVSESVAQKMLDARAYLSNADINDFAPQAVRTYLRLFEGYVAQGFPRRPNVAIYRYEDVIFEKRAWVDDICAWYGWDVDAAHKAKVAAMFDERPTEERPDEHVRQVTPGNYQQHLSKDSIEIVKEALGEYMRLFGYPL